MMDQKTLEKIELLLDYQHFVAIGHLLKADQSQQAKEVLALVDLAQAIIATDLGKVKALAQGTKYAFILEGSFIERRTYAYFQTMTRQIWQEEYGDYLRALTPMLVDVFRLAVIQAVEPNLARYIQPISKATVQGQVIYRGLQWDQSAIESHPNKIKVTWQKHYGDHFNYDHYVSSSHLIKLLEDHATNQDLVDRCQQMREIEKYLRNLAAHESVLVDVKYFTDRLQVTPVQVHQALLALMQAVGLNQKEKITIIEAIQADIRQRLVQ